MRTEVIDPADGQPVALAGFKDYLRIDGDDEDGILATFIKTATAHIEKEVDICLMERSVRDTHHGIEQSWPDIPEGYTVGAYMPRSQACIQLQARPLLAVTSIEYLAQGSTDWQVWSADNYTVDRSRPFARVAPATGRHWPTDLAQGESLRVNYRVGYGDNPNDVPSPLSMAVTTMAAHLYNSRGDAVPRLEQPTTPRLVATLIDEYRVVSV